MLALTATPSLRGGMTAVAATLGIFGGFLIAYQNSSGTALMPPHPADVPPNATLTPSACALAEQHGSWACGKTRPT